MTLTTEAILALAPDAGSAANGKKLATLSKWQNLNAPAGVLWGQCQGSGKDPYLTAIDLSGPVAKCSCPSRKFPCKHGLALLLLHVTHGSNFGTQIPPESIQTWLKGREERAGAKEQKAEEAAKKEVDPAAQAKRRAAREKKVTEGLSALHLFLKDLMRDGLAHANARPYSDWDTQAARLNDAQASGAARLVRQIPELLRDHSALFAHLGQLALLCEGWTNRESLSETELADLRTAIGFPADQASVLAQDGLKARWNVLGQSHAQEDHLRVRRTWLHTAPGAQDRFALLLDFAPPQGSLPLGLPIGRSVEATVCFTPSNAPLRGLLKGEALNNEPLSGCSGTGDCLALLDRYASALGQNPWLDRLAGWLVPVHLIPGPIWRLADARHQVLRLNASERLGLQLLALGGGEALQLFGEWDGQDFTPLSLLQDGQLIPLQRWENA